jgi:L-amino acid N-acyltransferase YncA
MHPAATQVVVRPARERDLGRIVDLFAEVAAEGRWIAAEPPVDRDRRRRRLGEALEDEHAAVLVAEVGGRVVGELGIELARYGVADLGMLVASGWRGRGIGSALLRSGI